jgi:DNA replication regulator DPB11
LISFRTEGAKYKAAKAWGLRIVSIEWLRDSLERGMILDESLYDPVLPPQQRGFGAWNKTKPKRTSLGKRSREDSVVSIEGGKRRLRRTASSKLANGNDTLWADISGGSLVPQVMRSGVWESTDEQTTIQNAENEAQKKDPAPASSTMMEAVSIPEPLVKGMFSGCRFYLDGFDPKKCQVLGDHLTPHGADMLSNIESFMEHAQQLSATRLFRLVPHNILNSKSSVPLQSMSKIDVVTEWWLEKCLHSKKFIEPSHHVVGRPFPKFPIEGFQNMTISSGGFMGIDLLHLQKSVALIGAKYSEDLTPHSSVLITKSESRLRQDKSEHAKEWSIPIVNANWLWESISAGQKLSIQPYRCRKIKGLSGPVPPENPSNQSKAERCKGDINRTTIRPESIRPETVPRPKSWSSNSLSNITHSRLDTTAFMSDDPLPVKKEEESQNPQESNDLNSSIDLSSKMEPLSEISHNTSPSRNVSTEPARSDHPAPGPAQEDLTLNISNLLAKTRKTTPAQNDPVEGRKRSANRILGRATSNVSTTSTPLSSVDSTATHGNPVEQSSHSIGLAKTFSEQSVAEQNHIEHFMSAGNDRTLEKDVDSQPPSTQLQYDDPESKEYQERVMARMKGEKVEGRKAPVKERSITLGDVTEQQLRQRARRSRAPPGVR